MPAIVDLAGTKGQKLQDELRLIEYAADYRDDYFPITRANREHVLGRTLELVDDPSPRVAVSALRVFASLDMVNARREATRVQASTAEQSIALAALREALQCDPGALAALSSRIDAGQLVALATAAPVVAPVAQGLAPVAQAAAPIQSTVAPVAQGLAPAPAVQGASPTHQHGRQRKRRRAAMLAAKADREAQAAQLAAQAPVSQAAAPPAPRGQYHAPEPSHASDPDDYDLMQGG